MTDTISSDFRTATPGVGTDPAVPATDRSSQIAAFEAEIEKLLQLLKAAEGSNGGSGAGADLDGARGGVPATSADTSPAISPASGGAHVAPPALGAAPASPTSAPSADPAETSANTSFNAASGGAGATVAIDGGNATGHGVTEKVDNDTGADAKFGWENAQGKVVAQLDLKDGESGAFNVNADGQDGKSARLIKLNDDGSVPDQSNLDETNLAVNPDGSLQVSPDVSQITAGTDATQISITDGNGKAVGNGAPGGAYLFPTQDQSRGSDNPMTMAMDTSNFYDNKFSK